MSNYIYFLMLSLSKHECSRSHTASFGRFFFHSVACS